jgi:hypothetical protein
LCDARLRETKQGHGGAGRQYWGFHVRSDSKKGFACSHHGLEPAIIRKKECQSASMCDA